MISNHIFLWLSILTLTSLTVWLVLRAHRQNVRTNNTKQVIKELSKRLANQSISINNPVFYKKKYHAVVLGIEQAKLVVKSASKFCNVQLVLEEVSHPVSKRQIIMRANSGGGLFYFTVYQTPSRLRKRRRMIVGNVISHASDPYIYMVYTHDV